jgi:NAD(P)-dependent dehydrogenase (short-subunit alcohol dehydrogenase family)
LLTAYRGLGFAVIANSRSIAESSDSLVVTVAGDVADPAVCERLVQTAVDRFGRLDTLINNAGIYIGKPFTDYTADDYAAATAVNMAGFFWLTQRAISQMLIQNTGGHIVSITTTLLEQADRNVPSVLAALTKGRGGRGHQVTGNRVRRQRDSSQRRLPRGHSDPDACRRHP